MKAGRWQEDSGMLEHFYILVWPKSLSRFFGKMLQKITKEILGQLNISGPRWWLQDTHFVTSQMYLFLMCMRACSVMSDSLQPHGL